MMEIPNQYQKNLYRALLLLLVVLSFYFAAGFSSKFGYRGMKDREVSSITLSGHGEVFAVPDIASVYFTIQKEAKTVKEAQDGVAAVETKALELLKNNAIEDKDTKTTNAGFYPKYDYNYIACKQVLGYCPPGKQVLVGYEASESITVKVRNTDEVGKLMQGLGDLGVTDLSGPNFSVDDEDALKAEARKKAIEDAKTKADALAKDLGVKLGKVISFSESGDYPVVYYAKEAGVDGDMGIAQNRLALPKGENMITSDVTIVYEIK